MSESILPSDSEMLDWMIKNSAIVVKYGEVYSVECDNCFLMEYYKTPRAAIAAEMAKEVE